VDGLNARVYYEISHIPGSSLAVLDCLSRDTFEDRRPSFPSCDRKHLNRVLVRYLLPSVLNILEEQVKELGDLDEYREDT
jgi:hypothetical protein